MARYLRQDNSTVLDSGLCFRRRIHVYLASLSVVVLSVTLAGCVTIGKQFPKATNGYVPKVTYNVAFDKAWGIVVRVLGENSISIASESKQTGQITTGYMEGTTSIGLFNAMSRYKYRIFILKIARTRTRINISPVLQSGGGDAGAFHDVTSSNQEIVKQLKNSLYEKIENAFKK